jgi:hypothetical protein
MGQHLSGCPRHQHVIHTLIDHDWNTKEGTRVAPGNFHQTLKKSISCLSKGNSNTYLELNFQPAAG